MHDPARGIIQAQARKILCRVLRDGAWESMDDLRTLVGQEIDRFLIKNYPDFVIDNLCVKKNRVHGDVYLVEIDLDVIPLDRPTLWATALLVSADECVGEEW